MKERKLQKRKFIIICICKLTVYIVGGRKMKEECKGYGKNAED